MNLTKIIRAALGRSKFSIKKLSRVTGIPYTTLLETRFNDPGSWRLYEISAVLQALEFTKKEKLQIIEILEKGELRAA